MVKNSGEFAAHEYRSEASTRGQKLGGHPLALRHRRNSSFTYKALAVDVKSGLHRTRCWEGTGFEPSVPRGKGPPLRVSVLFRSDFSVGGNQPEATFKDWSCHAGPMVRIRFPPAQSLRTTGSSARATLLPGCPISGGHQDRPSASRIEGSAAPAIASSARFIIRRTWHFSIYQRSILRRDRIRRDFLRPRNRSRIGQAYSRHG